MLTIVKTLESMNTQKKSLVSEGVEGLKGWEDWRTKGHSSARAANTGDLVDRTSTRICSIWTRWPRRNLLLRWENCKQERDQNGWLEISFPVLTRVKVAGKLSQIYVPLRAFSRFGSKDEKVAVVKKALGKLTGQREWRRFLTYRLKANRNLSD